MFISKAKASLTHFTLSLIVFSLFSYVLYNFWFPEPYFSATGGWQGLKLTAFIDVVLGPLLTFIVYNTLKSKKELIVDLSFIVVLQFSVLFFGIYTVSQQRPVAIVFWETSFYPVPANVINQHFANNAFAKQLLNNKPRLYFAEKPNTIEGLNAMFKKSEELAIPQHFLISLYKNYKKHFNEIKKYTLNIKEIIQANPKIEKKIQSILDSNNSKLTDNIYIALKSKYQNIVLVFNQQGDLLGYAKAPLFEEP